MDLEALRKHVHLSASSINDYQDCGLLYKFGRLDRVPREFTADALEFGTVIHRVLADVYQGKRVNRPHDLQEIIWMFEQYWTEVAQGNKEIRFAEGKDFETHLIAGRELLTVYYNNIDDNDFTVLAIEEPFSFTIPGLDIPIIGAWDLLLADRNDNLIIVDWKTAGRSYSNDDVDKNFQLTLYEMAARANGYADREILLRFDALIKTQKPQFKAYWTTRCVDDFKRAIIKIKCVADGIAKGVFIPAPEGHWKCTGCAYRQHCNTWFQEEAA